MLLYDKSAAFGRDAQKDLAAVIPVYGCFHTYAATSISLSLIHILQKGAKLYHVEKRMVKKDNVVFYLLDSFEVIQQKDAA